MVAEPEHEVLYPNGIDGEYFFQERAPIAAAVARRRRAEVPVGPAG